MPGLLRMKYADENQDTEHYPDTTDCDRHPDGNRLTSRRPPSCRAEASPERVAGGSRGPGEPSSHQDHRDAHDNKRDTDQPPHSAIVGGVACATSATGRGSTRAID